MGIGRNQPRYAIGIPLLSGLTFEKIVNVRGIRLLSRTAQGTDNFHSVFRDLLSISIPLLIWGGGNYVLKDVQDKEPH